MTLIIAAYNEEGCNRREDRAIASSGLPRRETRNSGRRRWLHRSNPRDRGFVLAAGSAPAPLRRSRRKDHHPERGRPPSQVVRSWSSPDATTVYTPNSLRELAANFADPSVGCVGGRVAYHYGDDVASSGFARLSALRRRDTKSRRALRFHHFGGAVQSTRSVENCFSRPLRSFTPDLSNPVHTVVQGKRVIYENDAVGLEESRTRFHDEYQGADPQQRPSRNSMLGYIVRELISSRRFGYLFQMVSHKFLRWWLGPLLLLALLTNLILIPHGTLYAFARSPPACGALLRSPRSRHRRIGEKDPRRLQPGVLPGRERGACALASSAGCEAAE